MLFAVMPIDVEKGGLLERIRLGELKSREFGEVLKVLEVGDAASDGRVKTPEAGLLLNLCSVILGI